MPGMNIKCQSSMEYRTMNLDKFGFVYLMVQSKFTPNMMANHHFPYHMAVLGFAKLCETNTFEASSISMIWLRRVILLRTLEFPIFMADLSTPCKKNEFSWDNVNAVENPNGNAFMLKWTGSKIERHSAQLLAV